MVSMLFILLCNVPVIFYWIVLYCVLFCCIVLYSVVFVIMWHLYGSEFAFYYYYYYIEPIFSTSSKFNPFYLCVSSLLSPLLSILPLLSSPLLPSTTPALQWHDHSSCLPHCISRLSHLCEARDHHQETASQNVRWAWAQHTALFIYLILYCMTW